MIQFSTVAKWRHLWIALVLACVQPTWATAVKPPMDVVASFSILADLARQVGGDDVRVTALVGPDGDAHVFEPTPDDARVLQQARVLVSNGLGFDPWLVRLKKASSFTGREVVASTGVQPRAFVTEPSAGGGAGSSSVPDPHAWQDASNAIVYVRNISEAFAAEDPANASAYRQRAKLYNQKLAVLNRDISERFAALPQQRRVFVTTHDAFGYFAHAYGLRILPAQGLSTETEPSAAGLARLVNQVRAQHIPAVFLENISDPRLMQQLARETGAVVGGKIYSDALSPPGGPAATYVQLMEINSRTIAGALGAQGAGR